MKRLTALKSISLIVLLVVAGIWSACGTSKDATSSSATSTESNPPDLVQIDYFYEQDSCFCLGLAKTWIDDTINTDYKAQIDSGKLIYNTYNSQNDANAAIMKQFNASLVSFFITTVRGTVRDTHEVKNLWLYTDPSGKNDMLHNKFLGILKGEMDKALAGN
jgi:hypothetical protein